MLQIGDHQTYWMVAAGALGWDGLGWPWEKPLVWAGLIEPERFTVVTKTLTQRPREGRRFAAHPIHEGVWNNIGLRNPGLGWKPMG